MADGFLTVASELKMSPVYCHIIRPASPRATANPSERIWERAMRVCVLFQAHRKQVGVKILRQPDLYWERLLLCICKLLKTPQVIMAYANASET